MATHSVNLVKAKNAKDMNPSDPGAPKDWKIKGRGICLSIEKLQQILTQLDTITNEVGHPSSNFDPPNFLKPTHVGFIITKAATGKRLTVDIFPLVGEEGPPVKLDFIVYNQEYGYSLSDGGGGPGIFRTPPPSVP